MFVYVCGVYVCTCKIVNWECINVGLTCPCQDTRTGEELAGGTDREEGSES